MKIKTITNNKESHEDIIVPVATDNMLLKDADP